VNIEFVVRRGPGDVAMRVHERGVGETWSCGTGACAVAVAAASWPEASGAESVGASEGAEAAPRLPATYTVQVPGGTLTVTWSADKHVHLKGPAVLVAEGTWRG
jgi:diaminopimelate epimerase